MSINENTASCVLTTYNSQDPVKRDALFPDCIIFSRCWSCGVVPFRFLFIMAVSCAASLGISEKNNNNYYKTPGRFEPGFAKFQNPQCDIERKCCQFPSTIYEKRADTYQSYYLAFVFSLCQNNELSYSKRFSLSFKFSDNKSDSFFVVLVTSSPPCW